MNTVKNVQDVTPRQHHWHPQHTTVGTTRLWIAGSAILAASLLLLTTVVGANAAPVRADAPTPTPSISPSEKAALNGPTWADVRRAKNNEQLTKTAVGQANSALDAAQTVANNRGEEAVTASARADDAQQNVDQAQHTLSDLKRQLAQQTQKSETAKRAAGAVIATLTRTGGIDDINAVLATSNNPTTTLQQLGSLTRLSQTNMLRLAQAQQAARQLSSLKAQQQREQDVLTGLLATAQQASASAQQASASANTAVTTAQQQSTTLYAKLADLKHTTTETIKKARDTAAARKVYAEQQAAAQHAAEVAARKAAQERAQKAARAEKARKAARAAAAADSQSKGRSSSSSSSSSSSGKSSHGKSSGSKASSGQSSSSKSSSGSSSSGSSSSGSSSGSSSSGASSSGASSSGSLSPSAAKAYARSAASGYGWGSSQYRCLISLWTRESGWRWSALNSSSGAYGIPQALPGSKMSTAGSNWRTSAKTQIRWGLGYISNRYSTPCGAWSHEVAVSWY